MNKERHMDPHRLHALDAIRGCALLLGLLLHGSMSFWPGLEQFGFPLSDASKSMTLTWMFYILHMFRMAVFFVIAGFFAHLSLHRKGPSGFVKDRLKRIALPMVVAFILSIFLIMPSVLWAAWKLYGENYLEMLNAARPNPNGAPELMHFWFLYYLLVFYALAVAASLAVRKLDANDNDSLMSAISGCFARLCRNGLLIALFTAISALVFYTRDNWSLWGGIPTPGVAFWREAPALVIYGLAFSAGWLLDRQRDCFAVFRDRWAFYVVLAVAATVPCIFLLPPQPFELAVIGREHKLAYALCYALACWCWVFAMIGAGLAFFNDENPVIRYIADASYWVYLAHIPVIFFLQAALMDVPLHWSVKFPVIIVITTAVCFWTYDRWVRYTAIGNLLNGPRRRPAVAGGAGTVVP